VVRTLLHGLSPDPVRTGVFMDGFTESDVPVIDYSSVSSRIVGAVGFGGHGFKMSPAVGQLLTELLLAAEGGDPIGPLTAHGGPFRRDSHQHATS
jgi:sarcosine oxidase